MTPQEHGRWMEDQIAQRYGWCTHAGSGNQWQNPSDAWAPNVVPFQIEIKTKRWDATRPTRFSLALGSFWEKLAQEAIVRGRIPVLVVAVDVEWAVAFIGVTDAEAWNLPWKEWPWRKLATGLRVTEDPRLWDQPRVYSIYKNNQSVPFWVRLPLAMVPGLV